MSLKNLYQGILNLKFASTVVQDCISRHLYTKSHNRLSDENRSALTIFFSGICRPKQTIRSTKLRRKHYLASKTENKLGTSASCLQFYASYLLHKKKRVDFQISDIGGLCKYKSSACLACASDKTEIKC